jgi:hypothetical protein
MKDKLIVAIATCVLTLVGEYVLQQVIQQKARPILTKEVYRTDLSGLPKEVQDKIPLVPIKYSLRHAAGGTVQNITVLIKTDAPLSISDVKFASESEDHDFGLIDQHTFKVRVPAIRPGGGVSFQLITPVANQITFSELADNAQILTSAELEAKNSKRSIYEIGIITAATVLWLALIAWVITIIWQIGKWWQDKEPRANENELRKKVITLIVAVLIYGVATGSLGPIGAWLPVPHFSFGDLLDGFVLYLLITRYRLIEAWLVAKTSESSKKESFVE